MKDIECPTCLGKGKITVQVQDSTGTFPFPMNCVVCQGAGKVSLATVKAHKAAEALWCDCGNPSGETEFHDDGEHPKCRKHCWTCKDCGKIVQVG